MTLLQEFDIRQTARAEGRRYCDPVAQRYQMEVIPEPLRLKPGSAAPQQMSVYEEFARNVPGFAATSSNANFSDLLGTHNSSHSRQHVVSFNTSRSFITLLLFEASVKPSEMFFIVKVYMFRRNK